MRGSLVAVAAALAALAIWQAAPGRDDRSDDASTAPLRADPGPESANPYVTAPPAASADVAAAPSHVTRAIDQAIDRHIEALGRVGEVDAAARTALRDALLGVRRASTRARRRPTGCRARRRCGR